MQEWGGNTNQEHQRAAVITQLCIHMKRNYMTKLHDDGGNIKYDIKHLRQEPGNLTAALNKDKRPSNTTKKRGEKRPDA